MPIYLTALIFIFGCSQKPIQNNNGSKLKEYNDTIVISKIEIPESLSIRFIYGGIILKLNINDLKNSFIDGEGLKYSSEYKSGLILFDLINHIEKSIDRNIILMDSIVSIGYEPIISLVRKGQFEIFKNNNKIDSIQIVNDKIRNMEVSPVVSGSTGYSLKDMNNQRLLFYENSMWIQ